MSNVQGHTAKVVWRLLGLCFTVPLLVAVLSCDLFDGSDGGVKLDPRQPGGEAVDVDAPTAARQPLAIEVCDGLDNDLDGETDAGAVDAVRWYTDADGDGWGDEERSVLGCSGPDGAVLVGADCDDENGEVHPRAPDPPNDGVDQDCDGKP